MPSGAIEKQNGMGARCDVARDFVKVELHHIGVGIGQSQGHSDAAGRTDRAEQIGVGVALIGGLAWPRSAPGPLAHEAVLLTDPGLVLKPYLDRRRFGDALEMSLQRAREILWNGPPLLPAS